MIMTGTVRESDAKLTPTSGLAWEKAGVATTAADKTATRNTSFFIVILLSTLWRAINAKARLRLGRVGDVRHRYGVGAAVALEQALVSRRQEREPR